MSEDGEPHSRRVPTYSQSDQKYARDMLAHIADARQIVELGEDAPEQ